MISDALTRLSGTRTVVSGVVTETPQDLDPAAAATPLLSEHWIDTADRGNPVRGGDLANGQLYGVFSINEEAVTSASAVATVRFQLITSPRSVATGQTFTADNTDETLVCTGDYLPNGTLVTVAGTLPTGLAASTHYYVYRDDTAAIVASPLTTFKLATTPDGVDRASPDVSTVATFTTNGSGLTITHIPEVIADSGEVPVGNLRLSNVHTVTPNTGAKADQVLVRANPLRAHAPLHRYLMARYVVSADLTAGKAFCDVGIGVPDNLTLAHASGFTVS